MRAGGGEEAGTERVDGEWMGSGGNQNREEVKAGELFLYLHPGYHLAQFSDFSSSPTLSSKKNLKQNK